MPSDTATAPPEATRGGVWRGVVLVVLCALLLRGGLALVDRPWPAVSDGVDYERMAGRLASGRGYVGWKDLPTAHRPPLQPAYRALVRATLGPSPRTAALVQALVGALGCGVLVLLGSTLAGARVGLVAGLALALYPRHIEAAVRHWSLSENLFITLLLVSLAFEARARIGRPLPALAAGAAAGLATLTRPVLLAYPPLAALAGRRRLGWLCLVVYLGGFGLTLGPWTLRNARALGAFVPVSSMGGVVLWQGQHPDERGFGFTPWQEIEELTRQAGVEHSEVERSRFLARAAVRDALADPARTAKLVLLKLLSLLNPYCSASGSFDPAYALALLMAIAALLRCRPSNGWHPLGLPLIYFVVAAAVFYGSPRFRLPVEPLLLLLAAVWWVRGPERRGFAWATGAMVVGVVVCWGLAEPLHGWIEALLGPPWAT